jgi:hypothetical protein
MRLQPGSRRHLTAAALQQCLQYRSLGVIRISNGADAAGHSGQKSLMENRQRNREIRANGRDIEPTGRWFAAQPGTLAGCAKTVGQLW